VRDEWNTLLCSVPVAFERFKKSHKDILRRFVLVVSPCFPRTIHIRSSPTKLTVKTVCASASGGGPEAILWSTSQCPVLHGSQWKRGATAVLKFMTASLLVVLTFAFGQAPLTTAQIAKRVSASVVVIQGKTDSGDVLGSGFIISKDGKIVTNLHVIKDMKTANVQLASGEIFDSISVLATDERRDLAVVHVAGFDLAALDLGNSDSVTVGEPVVVVGSPRGLEGTVTAGILSSVRDSGNGFKVLQTDAAVNPGNSGGPLVNGKGQAIGVVSFKFLSAEGLNFAIPINYVAGLLSELHDPISLDQMRRTLAATANSTNGQLGGGSYSKDTFDALTQAISSGHYQGTKDGQRIKAGSEVSEVDSCNIRFRSSYTSNPLTSPDTPLDQPQLASVFSSRMFTFPLKSLSGVGVNPVKNADGSFSGYYTLVLISSRKDISEQIISSESTPVSQSAEGASLYFGDEALARRTFELFARASDSCRQIGTTSSSSASTDGPSLAETLDWLKGKIPLAANHYVLSDLLEVLGMGRTKDVTVRTLPMRFDSCTVSLEIKAVEAWEKYQQYPTTTTLRYTIPLGDLIGGFLGKNTIPLSKSKNLDTWMVVLKTGSNVVLSETHEDLKNTTKSESRDSAGIDFYDESTAGRVLEAFWHASNLCRGKEPF
jgi:S1-C subfamily serine protease